MQATAGCLEWENSVLPVKNGFGEFLSGSSSEFAYLDDVLSEIPSAVGEEAPYATIFEARAEAASAAQWSSREIADLRSEATRSAPKTVSLGRSIKFGSVFCALACIESVALWLLGSPAGALLTPFPAILFLISSPFFYAMGSRIQ